jgi:hypothetical protein
MTLLPLEIQCYIFKDMPLQRCISKELNQHNLIYLYDIFHKTPVSKNEIINYIINTGNRVILFENESMTYIIKYN